MSQTNEKFKFQIPVLPVTVSKFKCLGDKQPLAMPVRLLRRTALDLILMPDHLASVYCMLMVACVYLLK